MNSPVVILHLEDDPNDAELVRDKLQQCGLAAHDLRIARGRREFEAALDETRFDLIISDYNLPDYDGMTALALAREKQPHVPFIMISGQLGEEKALECIHCGATDYVPKRRLDWLVPAVVRALAEAEERQKRKQAEETLVKAKNDLQSFFDLVPDLVVVASTDGYFRSLNLEWERVLGYTVEELLGNPYETFIHTDDIEPTRKEVERQMNGKGTSCFENRYRHKNGSYRWFEWKATPAVGELLCAAAHDISERLRAEQALRESEERFIRKVVNNGQNADKGRQIRPRYFIC